MSLDLLRPKVIVTLSLPRCGHSGLGLMIALRGVTSTTELGFLDF